MKVFYSLLLAAVLMAGLLLSGCEQPSMNLQRSLLRGGSDAGVTAVLDAVDADQVDAARETIANGFAVIRSMAKDNILSLGGLRITLANYFPAEYQPVAQAILAAVEGVDIPADKIGTNNLKRVLAVINGGEQALVLYCPEDRKPSPQVEPAADPAIVCQPCQPADVEPEADESESGIVL